MTEVRTPEAGEPTPNEIQQVAFTESPSYIEDSEGNRIPMPRRTARLELRVSAVLTKHVSAIADLDWPDIDFNNMNPKDMALVLPMIVENMPDTLGEVAAVVLDRDPATVLDEFSLEAIVDAIFPFLLGQVGLFQRVMQAVANRPSRR